ncbi:hypothetical protein D6C78_04200 [Aureobasidium pullulans]|uniref:Carboxylic ester hydrolase n=1 Tax=Aureobasidium pullulans TaxID=5580 RepID=A0A4T0BTP1_AURPU|nr:hypothetical protein D6C78_04200 [Aureobasidium pullulans]
MIKFSEYFAILGFALSASATSGPTVDLGYVRYQGVHNETLGINTFKGVHYAAPPIGDLRWRAPVPIESRNNFTGDQIVDATVQGNQCVQGVPGWVSGVVANVTALLAISAAPPPSNEDCLLLDVIVPSKPVTSSLPVIIQIHGGGYTMGSSTSSDGSQLVGRSDGSVIYVQIQYRLGAYGFLGASIVREDGVANAGLLDQREAMRWVQRNIRRFGGDPARVTIWGGSAGGGSVAKYPYWNNFPNETALETQYDLLRTASNCSTLACLRNLPAAALANATQTTYFAAYISGQYPYGEFYYVPTIDGVIIRDTFSTEFERGHFSKVPLLTDHDAFEGATFANFSVDSVAMATANLKQRIPLAGPSYFARLYELYPLSSYSEGYFSAAFFQSIVYKTLSSYISSVSTENTVFWRLQEIIGDLQITCVTYWMGSALVNTGQKVWKLKYSTGSFLHGATAAPLFLASSSTTNTTQSDMMKDYFLSFAIDLDPNSFTPPLSNLSRPYWPEYVDAQDYGSGFSVLEVNETRIGVVTDQDASARCDFLQANAFAAQK